MTIAVILTASWLAGIPLAYAFLSPAWMLGPMRLTLAVMWPAWPVICAGIAVWRKFQ